MTETIKVAISPFYKGMGWIDPGTQLVFESGPLMKYYTIPKNRDLTGIKRSVMLNQLILVEGDLDDVEDIRDNTEELEQEINNLTSQIAGLEQENGNLTSQVAGLEQQISDLNNQIVQLEQELQEEKDKNSKPGDSPEEPQQTNEEELEGTTENIEVQAQNQVFENGENESLYSQEEVEDLTIAKIKEILDAKEIDYDSNAKKAELVELLVGLPK